MGEAPPGASPFKTEENSQILRKLLFIHVAVAVVVVAVALVAGCGSNSSDPGSETTGTEKQFAHEVAPEIEEKILADAVDDLKVIAATGADTSQLPTVLTGSALESTKNSIAADAAQGKVRKRDYQNINVRMQGYVQPQAEVFAEFDDSGYYVDAATGAALGSPANEHKSYALAMVEEGGRWKIQMILSPTATSPTTPS